MCEKECVYGCECVYECACECMSMGESVYVGENVGVSMWNVCGMYVCSGECV